ncbi:MAG TPA: efflux RND transporter permease subunit [Terracidiphilus sp.]|jgi:multidrug efflux pump subunit AcrB|nr:efflux RND transporter permease subunit [Terracidiphilus sp.]
MPKFALRYPFFILMLCLMVSLVGGFNVFRMPVDLFPKIDMPVVVVATFYNGMPPEQIEADITNTFERFFTLASNVDHSESRSLTGVSLIKIYFKPGTDPNAALSNIANLAMADLRRLPPGTLPPVVLGMDASTQPVCLVTLKGQGLNETSLKDLAQFQVRNQISNVQGASVPQPYGGTYRQIQIYVDPLKLEARNMSLNDVVKSVDSSNLILPAGDVRIGSKDYNIYANSQFPDAKSMNAMPLKTVGNSSVLVGDIGKAEDSGTLQYNIVRIDGQRSVYVPIFKQGGDSNTISIVNGIKAATKKLVDIPDTLHTAVVFDQSIFVKLAISNVSREAGIGLVLTGVMILVFLGSPRATLAVLLAVPLSMIACLLLINFMGGSINTMILGGLALVFSRLIDNGVIVLENIFRHMEMGLEPQDASDKGGTEVSLAVLAATFTTAIVFFPVAFFSGVSKYIFTPLALGVAFSIFASYFFAMTVVPLFCAKFIRLKDDSASQEQSKLGFFGSFDKKFNRMFQSLLNWYERKARIALRRPGLTTAVIMGGIVLVLLVTFPFLGRAYFPRTDPGQFIINVRMPSGSRLEVSNNYIAQVEDVIRGIVPKSDLDMIVSNIGVYPDLSAIYTSNASMDTAFVQVSLKEDHRVGSYEYMRRVQQVLSRKMPELSTYFQAGGLVDGVINQGLPAPIDVQIKAQNVHNSFALARELATKIQAMPDVSSVYIPQSINYPGLELNIDRERASLVGLSAKDVVDDVITALTSDGMVAPSYWIDPKSGNNYMVTVQYANRWINNMSMEDLKNIPLRGARSQNTNPTAGGGRAMPVSAQIVPNGQSDYVPLGAVADIQQINTPTEVDHMQIRRVIDVYVATRNEALQSVGGRIDRLVAQTPHDRNTVIDVRGAVQSMNQAFHDFGIGLILAILLVYLILMAQFTSFIDPFIILMAIPPGLAGVALILVLTGSTLNIMSLMGVIMMTGVVVSNSILIVEFTGNLREQGMPLLDAAVHACRVRLRPILMTSLATLLGMIPMALGVEAGSEQYAPLARAIIGGLGVSVVVTMFLVPAVYLMIHGRREARLAATQEGSAQ